MRQATKTKRKREAKPLPEKLTIEIVARELWITNNSKAGACLDMDAYHSCPEATEACGALIIKRDGKQSETVRECYATQGVYGFAQPRYRRNRQLIERSIQELGIEATAKAIVLAIQHDKNAAWAEEMRLHGSGDIFSVEYCKVLIHVVQLLRKKKFWLYTRSFRSAILLPSIVKLAKQPNVSLNLSADWVNWEDAYDCFTTYPVFNAIACMQGKEAPWIGELAKRGIKRHQLILFPQHQPNKHEAPLRGVGIVCPEILGAFQDGPPACLRCHSICKT